MKRKLATMTKTELYKQAQQRQIRGRSKMTKTQLLNALSGVRKKERPTSGLLPRNAKRKQEQSAGPEARLNASSPVTSPPPRPTAPQYLTPLPAEVYQGEEGPGLPDHLPVTVLKAMPRDPHWIFLYWNIHPEDKAKVQLEHGEWIFDRSIPILRVHEVETGASRDIPVLLDARNWYLPVAPDRSYQFELGIVIAAGEFIALVSSKEIRTPAAEPSFQDEEQWLAVEELYRELVDIYGEFTPGPWPGSPGSQGRGRREGIRFNLSHISSLSSQRGRP